MMNKFLCLSQEKVFRSLKLLSLTVGLLTGTVALATSPLQDSPVKDDSLGNDVARDESVKSEDSGKKPIPKKSKTIKHKKKASKPRKKPTHKTQNSKPLNETSPGQQVSPEETLVPGESAEALEGRSEAEEGINEVKNVPVPSPQDIIELDNTKGALPEDIQTLEQALVAAYIYNTDIQSKRQELRVAEEKIVEAKAGYRPNLSLEGNLSFMDQITSGNQKDLALANPQSGLPGSNTENKQATGGIRARQNLFKGWETVSTVAQLESQREIARLSLIALEQKTFIDTVNAYLSVLSVSAEVRLYEANVKAMEETLKASQEKFKVGEETRTSVAQAEAQLAVFRAQLKSKQAELEGARATLKKLTGLTLGKLSKPKELADFPATLEEALAYAMLHNPSILAAKFTVEAAEHGIDVATSGLLPQVDLDASTTFSRTNTRGNGSSLSILRGRSLDNQTQHQAVIRASIPLYEGGAVRARVRSAHETSEKSRIDLETTRRQVTQDLTLTWYTYEAARANLDFFRLQVSAQSISLEGTQQEMAVGTKILLDVLDERRKLVQAEQNLVGAEREYYASRAQIKALEGDFSPQRLGLPLKEYDIDAHYSEVKIRW